MVSRVLSTMVLEVGHTQTCRSIKLLSLSSAQLIVFEFQRRSNSKRMSWVCAQIFEFRLFFFAITKRGQYRLWTYLTSLLKRGRESLLKKRGEEWEDKGHFERKNWIERRSFYLILCTIQTQFFLVKQNSKIEFEFDFAQSLSALAESLVERGNFGTGAFVNNWLID